MAACFLAWSICGASANAISVGYQPGLARAALFYAEKHPKWVMDASIKPDDPIEKGVDCRRLMYLIHRDAAVPGIQCVTSERMSRGFGGWEGYDVQLKDTKQWDLIFFTFPPRIRGHVGARYYMTLYHASSSRGPVFDDLTSDWILEHFAVGRHLTIGE